MSKLSTTSTANADIRRILNTVQSTPQSHVIHITVVYTALSVSVNQSHIWMWNRKVILQLLLWHPACSFVKLCTSTKAHQWHRSLVVLSYF